MALHKIYKGFIVNILNYIKNKSYRIEMINIPKKTIVLHCPGVDAPIKMTFKELIFDSRMLSNLSPKHASWVGYYYSKYCSEVFRADKHLNIKFDYSIENSYGKFRIIMLNRKSELIYIDSRSNQTKIISSSNAISNPEFIKNFHPIQACYIGILAGTQHRINLKLKRTTTTHLRLID